MLATLGALNALPLWVRVAIASLAVVGSYLFQIPIATDVPGEPFLLFFAVVVGCTLAFGRTIGFFSVALTSFLSLPFFEPGSSLYISNAADLIEVELYALFSAGTVLVIGRVGEALLVAHQEREASANLEREKSVLLTELTHRVANNFAVLSAVIRQKSVCVTDPHAKTALEEAVEQMSVMARIHGQLCLGAKDGKSIDSQTFIRALCEDILACAGNFRRLTAIECVAVSHPLHVADAVPLGLIINELVINALKYAFPDGTDGRIWVSLEEIGTTLRLTVNDNGVGLQRSVQGTGLGHRLVSALAQQLAASLEIRCGFPGTIVSITFDPDRRLSHLSANRATRPIKQNARAAA
jgi:two-component system, sensor histidine kinase PdtaS